MMNQRNSRGGFHTTTDTVLGIQALSMYAEKVYSPTTHMEIDLLENNKVIKTFNLTNANAFEAQTKMLPYSTRAISFEVRGAQNGNNGFAYVQITKSYYSVLNLTDQFFISAVPQASGNEGVLDLKVCASFRAVSENMTASGMTLIEIQLPSGYEYDSDCSEKLLTKTDVKVIIT